MSSLSPARLAAALAALPVRVESAEVERRAVHLADYPGGPRPSSLLRLHGAGQTGLGEHVAFEESEHEAFAGWVQGWLSALPPPARLQVGDRPSVPGSPYDHAALEAALIDLALRQAGRSLAELSGERVGQLRVVVSFASNHDPSGVIQSYRHAGYDGDFKIDVDPSWGNGVLDELARETGLAVLDFKGRGTEALAARISALLPNSLLEDPPAGFVLRSASGRISRDASLRTSHDVAEACARGEAVNLKAPRMGGPLAVLASLELALGARTEVAAAAGPPPRAYLGGMFEVSVGRTQAQQLAALFCATSPNDLALNLANEAGQRRLPAALLPVRLDTPGFGTR